MRTIKFRAWHKAEKKMYAVDAMRFDYNGLFTVDLLDAGDHYTRDCIDLNEVELMQFTGLKDEAGKEIYEGDIVKWLDVYVQPVRWDIEEAMFLPNHMSMDVEIIGNIYENPELLEKP
jgi:uncharacterized phage protein (TIGR01671 family)